MSEATSAKKCASCSKSESELDRSLQHCGGCKEKLYCSRECQKADWKAHEPECRKTQSATSSPRSNLGGAQDPDWPAQIMPARMPPNNYFDELDVPQNADILAGRDENTTYRLLIDAYRIFDEDRRIDAGTMRDPRHSYFEGGKYLTGYKFKGLQKFLTRAKKGGFLPEWWSEEKRKACEKFAKEMWHWSDIETNVDVEVNEWRRYGGPRTRLPMRVLGWAIMGVDGGKSRIRV